MAINIPTRENKVASQIRDGLRILAWNQFKAESKDSSSKGLELYKEIFEPEWLKHEVHSMNLKQLTDYVTSLGYNVEELFELRNKYYNRRNGNSNGNGNGNGNWRQTTHQELSEVIDEMPF